MTLLRETGAPTRYLWRPWVPRPCGWALWRTAASSYDPFIPLLVTCPQEVNTYVHRKACTRTSSAALFITSKHLKQPEHPATGEQMGKGRHNHTVEYYSAGRRNEVLTHVTPWRDLKNPGEVRVARHKHLIFHGSVYVTLSRKPDLRRR